MRVDPHALPSRGPTEGSSSARHPCAAAASDTPLQVAVHLADAGSSEGKPGSPAASLGKPVSGWDPSIHMSSPAAIPAKPGGGERGRWHRRAPIAVSSRGGFTGGVLARSRSGPAIIHMRSPWPRTCLSTRCWIGAGHAGYLSGLTQIGPVHRLRWPETSRDVSPPACPSFKRSTQRLAMCRDALRAQIAILGITSRTCLGGAAGARQVDHLGVCRAAAAELSLASVDSAPITAHES